MTVVVIGAGVTGLSVGFHLLELGIQPVTVLDRGGVGSGASGIQPGGVRQQWSTRAACAMARESFHFYRDFPARLGTVARARLQCCGYLFVADDETTLRRLEAALAVQHDVGVPSRLLAPEDAAALVPGLDPEGVVGAAYCGEDGFFDRPQAVVEAFAELCRARGVRILREEAQAIVRDGRGWRIETRAGGHAADVVVAAAASETRRLLAPLGVALPLVDEPRYLFLGEPLTRRLLEPFVVAVDRRVAAKQLADGRLLASDLAARGDPRTERGAWRRRLREQLVPLLPALEYVPLPVLVDGVYDLTPDGQPIVDEVEPGLWCAAGFSGHGFMVAPAVGRAVADGVAGRAPAEWLDALRAARFTAGGGERELQIV